MIINVRMSHYHYYHDTYNDYHHLIKYYYEYHYQYDTLSL